MDLSHELKIAEDLARHAGRMALAKRDQLVVSHKPDGQGPVTDVDIAIDRYICQNLAREFPHDRIISEESYRGTDALIGKERTWLIDPIDGTAGFILGGEDFVIMIGLAIDGVARMGVVFQPTNDKLWRGIFDETGRSSIAERIEKGKFLELDRTILKQPTELKLLVSRTNRSSRQDLLIKELKPHKILYRSSVGLKAMMILERSADFYVAWSKQIKLWDTCAPAAIIQAARATMALIDGKKLSYLGPISHSKPIMVANFAPSAKLMATLAEIADKR